MVGSGSNCLKLANTVPRSGQVWLRPVTVLEDVLTAPCLRLSLASCRLALAREGLGVLAANLPQVVQNKKGLNKRTSNFHDSTNERHLHELVTLAPEHDSPLGQDDLGVPVVLVARRDQADPALVDGVVGLAPALPVGDADVAKSSKITALVLLLAQGTETGKGK